MTKRQVNLLGLEPNTTYVTQIRGVNADEVGPWSMQLEFDSLSDTVRPAPPQNVSAEFNGADVYLTYTKPTVDENGDPLTDLRDIVITVYPTSTPAQTRDMVVNDEALVFGFDLNRSLFMAAMGGPVANLTFEFRARDRAGNLSNPATDTAVNAAPTAPTVTPTAKRNAVELKWTNAFSDDGLRYDIWKNAAKYAEVSATTLIWTDTDVGSGAQNYMIRAIDVFGQATDSATVTESELSIGVGDTIAPNPPTTLSTTSPGATGVEAQVTMSWDAPVANTDTSSYTDNEGFELRYRKDISRPWSYVRIPDERTNGTIAQTFSYDIVIEAGGTLTWEVRAFDRSSNYSTWANATFTIPEDVTPPAAPTNLFANGGVRTITAGWDKNTENDLSGYRVYSSPVESQITATHPALPSATHLVFDGLGNSASWATGDAETWYVVVYAYDVAGNFSQPSTKAWATTMGELIDTTPPADVTGFSATNLTKQFYYHGSTEQARIIVDWADVTDSDLFGYIVAWQETNADGTIDPARWTEEVVSEASRFVLSGLDPSYEVVTEDGQKYPSTYAFRIKAVDNSGNPSVNWAGPASISLDYNDGSVPDGSIREPVDITANGAIQSENFLPPLRGFRLGSSELELYGSPDSPVSMQLGGGARGLNLSTINDQLWFGSYEFNNASWRVDGLGNSRFGGPGAVAEAHKYIAEHPDDTITKDERIIRVRFDTVAPTATGVGDLWANPTTDVWKAYEWDGVSWIDTNDSRLYTSIEEVFDSYVLPNTYTHTVQFTGENLAANSSFEDDSDGDGFPDSWQHRVGGINATNGWWLATDVYQFHAKSLRCITPSTAPADRYVSWEWTLEPGDYVASVWVKGDAVTRGTSTVGGAGLNLDHAGGTGTITALEAGGLERFLTGTFGWTRVSVPFRISTASVLVRAYLQLGFGGTVHGTAWWDGFQIEAGSAASSYTPKTNEALAGDITAYNTYDVLYTTSLDTYVWDGAAWTDPFDAPAVYINPIGDIWTGADHPGTINNIDPSVNWALMSGGEAFFRHIHIEPDNSLISDGEDVIRIADDSGGILFSVHHHTAGIWELHLGTNLSVDAGGDIVLNADSNFTMTDGNFTMNGGLMSLAGGAVDFAGAPVTISGSDLTITNGNIILTTGIASAVNPTGVIRSDNYSYANRTGWALDSGSLYLFEGEIEASLIDIQAQQNLLEYGYTTIPYPLDWYNENLHLTSVTAAPTSLWSRYGPQGLRLQGSIGAIAGLTNTLDSGLPNYNRIKVEPGSSYIFSAYVYNNSVADKSIQLFVRQSNDVSIESTTFTIPAGTYERIHFVATMETGVTGAYPGFILQDNTADFIIDGVQLELRRNSDLPSFFNIGGSTTIDGDAIKTGSITSHNYDPTVPLASRVGWRITLDGDVEFHSGIFRGDLFAEDLVAGTITNQNYLLSPIQELIEDPRFEQGWAKTEVLSSIA